MAISDDDTAPDADPFEQELSAAAQQRAQVQQAFDTGRSRQAFIRGVLGQAAAREQAFKTNAISQNLT